MLGWKRNKKATEKKEGSVVKPVLISLRKYREIFGDSDEEVLHFTLFSCLLQSFGNLAGISYVIILFFFLFVGSRLLWLPSGRIGTESLPFLFCEKIFER